MSGLIKNGTIYVCKKNYLHGKYNDFQYVKRVKGFRKRERYMIQNILKKMSGD